MVNERLAARLTVRIRPRLSHRDRATYEAGHFLMFAAWMIAISISAHPFLST
jgi:hypothetical protein